MDKTQRLVVVLLVLAILFSGISIFISFVVLNVDVPDQSPTAGLVEGSEGSGGVSLSIERPPERRVG